MSSLFLPQATIGLPEELYEDNLFKAHEELPEGLQVGSVLIDKAREAAFVICQATNAKIDDKVLVQQTVTIQTDSTDVAVDKGTRGSKKVTLTAQSGTSVTKDQFKGGTVRALGSVQYIYKVQSNTATASAGGTFDVMVTNRLVTDIAKDQDLRIRSAVKTEQANAASSDPAPAVAMTLCEVPANYYYYGQAGGEADITSAAITSNQHLGLAKAANGRVAPAGAGQQIVAYHTRDFTGNVTAGAIIPVHLVIITL